MEQGVAACVHGARGGAYGCCAAARVRVPLGRPPCHCLDDMQACIHLNTGEAWFNAHASAPLMPLVQHVQVDGVSAASAAAAADASWRHVLGRAAGTFEEMARQSKTITGTGQ